MILQKSTSTWGFLPPSIVYRLISMKKYIVVAETYTNLTKMDKLEIKLMDLYLYSCNSAKSAGILTCEEDIVFDVPPEKYPIFYVELNGILMKCGLLSVLSTTSGAGGGATPTKLFIQEIWLGKVLQLVANNMTLWWKMGKEGMDGISLWGWMKVRYETAPKL